MINLFYSYNQQAQDLHYSLQAAGYEQPTVVIRDGGFLPEQVASPLKFLLDQAGSVFQGRPRYFNEIDLPEYWEIKANSQNGEILDHGQVRGKIEYCRQDRRRLVAKVKWLDLKGTVRAIDHYNQWGWKFAVTSCDAKGNEAMTSFFASSGQEVLVHNHFTGDYIYNAPDGRIVSFRDVNQLVAYFLQASDYDASSIAFNSLGTCLFSAMQVKPKPDKNLLFWQEISQGGVPDNMRYLLAGNLKRTKVIVQDQAEYQKLVSQLDRETAKRVFFLGQIYPFKRENRHRSRALIFTNSDQIEGLKQLVEALPELHFDVAAVTEMSSRLLNFGKYENVSLYPVVRDADVAELLKTDDIYLDINYANEILNAGRQAFENNMAVFAFRDTMHAPSYTAPENVFAAGDAEGLVHELKAILADQAAFDAVLKRQHEFAGAESPEHYRQVLDEWQ